MKELDDFTVEELHELAYGDESTKTERKLARIALAAKTAEPVTWWTGPEPTWTGELESFHDHETGGHQIPLVPALYTYPLPNSPELPDGWIKCSERMPRQGDKVLVNIDFESEIVGPLIKDAEYTGSTFRIGPNTVNTDGEPKVTHWQPLPAPPTTEK